MNKNKIIILILLLTFFSFSCREQDEPCECEPDAKIEKYSDYFIAHAGGAIDGIYYTNSVEALNLSYSKGCRLFELDLVYTTDNKIVAKHDPPNLTEAEFMSQLISGKYTPMNMEAINLWFQHHPDAILVPDKIHDPQPIYDEFIFKDRLIMELLSWNAVDKAIELGITPLVSSDLIFDAENIEKILFEKKITYIGMSRYSIAGNENLLRKLKNKGIKNYIWHIDQEIMGLPGEYYVYNYENDFVYGMYADNLDLLDSLLHKQ